MKSQEGEGGLGSPGLSPAWQTAPGRIRDFARPLRRLDLPGFALVEAVYDAGREVPPQPDGRASLCLTVEGGYQVDWGITRVRCGPASLLFHAPDEVYGARISDEGSRCLTIGIDPVVLLSATEALPALGRLHAARRGPPSWLAFQLRRELELGDDLSLASVESTVLALLAEVGERPAFEARGAPPPWLERVKEQIHDEFARPHTLRTLARTGDVHRVHLAREFRRHFGCTVGDYIRQRRVEFACHRTSGFGRCRKARCPSWRSPEQKRTSHDTQCSPSLSARWPLRPAPPERLQWAVKRHSREAS